MVRESPSDYNTRLTVLETKMDEIVKDVNKLETTVSENYSTLHSRIDVLKDDIHSSIFDSHTKVMDRLDLQSKNSSMQHDAINAKIQSLEKWRWMLVGAAIVLGYVFAHIKIDNLF